MCFFFWVVLLFQSSQKFVFLICESLFNNIALSASVESLFDFPRDTQRLTNWCEHNYFKINVKKKKKDVITALNWDVTSACTTEKTPHINDLVFKTMVYFSWLYVQQQQRLTQCSSQNIFNLKLQYFVLRLTRYEHFELLFHFSCCQTLK